MPQNEKTFYFQKLVRDQIVTDFKKDSSVTAIDCKKLSPLELKQKLKDKIHEEANEIPIQDESDQEVVSEISDLLDVIEALQREYKISDEQIRRTREKKNLKLGGFINGDYINSITFTIGTNWEKYCSQDSRKFPTEASESQIYRHNKTGNLYKLLFTALDTENNTKMVVYEALYETVDGEKTFARPEIMFHKIVTVNGEAVPRFELVK